MGEGEISRLVGIIGVASVTAVYLVSAALLDLH